MSSVAYKLVRRGCLSAAAVCVATAGLAADWQALAIGQPGPGRDRAFADAFHATGALSRGGGRDVLMMRDAAPAAVLAAVSAWPAGTDAIVYLSGVIEGGSLRLKGGDLPLDDMLGAFAARQVGNLALLIEDCVGRDATPLSFAMPQPVAGLRLLVAASAAGATACPDGAARLTERLVAAHPSDSLQTALDGMILTDGLGIAVPIAEAATEAASPIIAAAAPVSVVSRDVVSVAPVVSPVRGDATLSPVSPIQAVARADGNTDAVLIFAAPAASQRAALPRATGLPEPSIIVGLLETATPASFERVTEQGAVGTNEIAYDNLAARRGLRAQDADLYASLVAAGAFDPPQPLMARALQEELSRMSCYTSGIDGVWGNGSRAAVQRYFDERAGVAPVTLEPEARLFRQIILQDDVTCPAPQVTTRTPAPAAATTRSTPQAQPQQARPRATATPAAPRQQPAPQTGTRRIQSGTALGVFR